MARLRLVKFTTRLPARKSNLVLEGLADRTYSALAEHKTAFGVDSFADLDNRSVTYTLLLLPGISEWEAKSAAKRTFAALKDEKVITSFSEVQ